MTQVAPPDTEAIAARQVPDPRAADGLPGGAARPGAPATAGAVVPASGAAPAGAAVPVGRAVSTGRGAPAPPVAVDGLLVAAIDAAALGLAAVATGAPWWAVCGYLLATLSLLAATGGHRPRITLRLGDELPFLVGCALVPAALLAYTGARPLLVAPVLAVALTLGRSAGYAVLRAARRRGLFAEPTLVVGTGTLACDLAEAVAAHPEFGLVPYGFVDARAPVHPVPLPWLGDVAALPHLAAAHRIRRVVVCFPDRRDAELVPVLRALPGVRIHLVPRLYELGRSGSAAGRDEVWGIPLVPLRRTGRCGAAAKRAADVVLASLLLVAVAPLLAVLALAARTVTGGTALFRQSRLTRTGRVATIVKLRTVPPDPAGDAAADTRWAVPVDQCGRLARLLRATHADELPQLVNVLRGEMSLVGPRPERPYFAALFAEQLPGYHDRHRMPGGITGWAQVHGLSGDTSVAERARFDNRYVEDWSLWMDLVILVRTLATVCPRRAGGAR